MPYVRVKLGGVAVCCAGAEDVEVLSAGVLVSADGYAQVDVSGMRTAAPDAKEHLFWTSRDLARGGKAEIELLQHASSLPGHTILEPFAQIPRREIEDLKRESDALREALPLLHAAAKPVRASWPIALVVTVDQNGPVVASLGPEEQLQAEVWFTRQAWQLRVHALTVLENGNTKGKCWIERELSPGQVVGIAYKD